MGLWGAAQAIAAGFGGFLGAAAVDAMRASSPSPPTAYGAVFLAEAALFRRRRLPRLPGRDARPEPQPIPGE